MAGIAITRMELTAVELRRAAGRSKDARAARRMLAITLVLEGVDRATAAATCGMDPQTLRGEEGQETVRGTVFPTNGHRYNAEGVAGLVNRTVPQRARRLAPEQLAALAAFGRDRSRPGSGRRGALASP